MAARRIEKSGDAMAWRVGEKNSKGMVQNSGELRRKNRKEENMPTNLKKSVEERKKDITKEALRFLRASLQKEYDGLRAEWENISAEYLGKINAIDVMLEEEG